MGDVVLDISMSLDGFVTGPNVGIEHPLGEDGERSARLDVRPRPQRPPTEEAR
jgi:hypothetical protein